VPVPLRDDDELSALVALRDELADAIDGALPDKIAPLAAQFRVTVGRIAQIRSQAPAVTSKADEVAERRARRRSKPVRDGQTREA
jgi:hypothetical protein